MLSRKLTVRDIIDAISHPYLLLAYLILLVIITTVSYSINAPLLQLPQNASIHTSIVGNYFMLSLIPTVIGFSFLRKNRWASIGFIVLGVVMLTYLAFFYVCGWHNPLWQ